MSQSLTVAIQALRHAVVLWPWEPDSWKPTDQRRNLVKAGALILAEIDRIDRAAALAQKEQSHV